MKKIKQIKEWIKYNFSFLTVLNSPLKGLKLIWYFGEITKGTPYFLPRKWVKATPELAMEATLKYIERELAHNKLNPNSAREIKSSKEIYDEKIKYSYAIPIKWFGINYTTLGWKTKWSSTDFRYEWCPMFSLVIFGKQLHITVVPNVSKDSHYIHSYWEAYLNWEYNTDKHLSKDERFKQLIDRYSCTWIDTKHNKEDHYLNILDEKYLEIYKQIKK